MQTNIVEVYTCDCRPSFNWKNKNTYKAHFRSQRHKQLETAAQELDHRKTVVRLQIEVDKLKAENEQLKDKYTALLYRYDDLLNSTSQNK